MKIEILCTGDEILSGKTVNTNYSHMARRLCELGFEVVWGTVVGDDSPCLKASFLQASQRADAVIVNGGLGPTVDDLSQEVAAEAAGVSLELHQDWYDRIDAWYAARGRKMPPNNQKQAMLPEGAEFIDNPIGTACGFAIDINQARFFFTPGVPREMKRMVEEQIIPRLQAMRGTNVVSKVKRFHSFGVGESRANQILDGIEALSADGAVKLGFQSHYPQLEIKLTAQDEKEEVLNGKIQPLAKELEKRLGNFVVAEDDETLEGRIVEVLKSQGASLSVIEMQTAGRVIGRLVDADDGETLRWGLTVSGYAELTKLMALPDSADTRFSTDLSADTAARLAKESGSEYALVVLTRPLDDPDQRGSEIFIAVADAARAETRYAVLPGRPIWVKLGAMELALDCLRRFLFDLPIYEKIDFEQH